MTLNRIETAARSEPGADTFTFLESDGTSDIPCENSTIYYVIDASGSMPEPRTDSGMQEEIEMVIERLEAGATTAPDIVARLAMDDACSGEGDDLLIWNNGDGSDLL